MDPETLRKYLELLSAIGEQVGAISERSKELHSILTTGVLKIVHDRLDPVDIDAVITVDREVLRYRFAPLRCEGTEKTLKKILLRCEGPSCYIELLTDHGGIYSTVLLSNVTVADVLKLACNVKVEEMERFVEIVREKAKRFEEDIARLKELIVYSKMLFGDQE